MRWYFTMWTKWIWWFVSHRCCFNSIASPDEGNINPGILTQKGSASSNGSTSPIRNVPIQTTPRTPKAASDEKSVPAIAVQSNQQDFQNRSWYDILFSSCFNDNSPMDFKNSHTRDIVEKFDLQPWHLHRMKRKFDEIDIDKSGNISSEEFLVSTGSSRSQFTDMMFHRIGKCEI